MTSNVSLAGLLTVQEPEDRALAILDVDHNNQKYQWKKYVDKGVTDLTVWLQDISSVVLAEIDAKEAVWDALDPKTKTVIDPETSEELQVPIPKEDIVKPDIPDYYALRRAEYPSIGDQLDAYWKGVDSPEYTNMLQKIQSVKQKYPKPV